MFERIWLVDLEFNILPTAKVIWKWDLGLLSHLTDWRSPGPKLPPLVYKASEITTAPRRLLKDLKANLEVMC